MSDRTSYSPLQIVLHWLIAILIFATWFTHEDMGRTLRDRIDSGATGTDGNTLHVWLGSAALILIVIRIVVRALQGAPDWVPETSPTMAAAALWGHRLLYLLMLGAPLLGALAWYGGFKSVGELHDLAGTALFFVAIGHALVAIWHQVVLKDGVMARMKLTKG